jgi:hypothetical protein
MAACTRHSGATAATAGRQCCLNGNRKRLRGDVGPGSAGRARAKEQARATALTGGCACRSRSTLRLRPAGSAGACGPRSRARVCPRSRSRSREQGSGRCRASGSGRAPLEHPWQGAPAHVDLPGGDDLLATANIADAGEEEQLRDGLAPRSGLSVHAGPGGHVELLVRRCHFGRVQGDAAALLYTSVSGCCGVLVTLLRCCAFAPDGFERAPQGAGHKSAAGRRGESQDTLAPAWVHRVQYRAMHRRMHHTMARPWGAPTWPTGAAVGSPISRTRQKFEQLNLNLSSSPLCSAGTGAL